MNKKSIIPSVNFHLWEPCNMRCKFCFATFQDIKKTILPKGHLPQKQAIEIVKQLAVSGFQKITFAGGEPTLCPWLPELIKTAKELGMTTMIVTNGSKLSEKFLEKNKKYLDWITISIDSLDENTNLSIGRAILGKKIFSEENYLSLVESINSHGYGLKVNTVVNRFNFSENMNAFIDTIRPKRWKVFQVLPIKGQNDRGIDKLKISNDEFEYFIEKHKEVKCLVSENNTEMTGSYAMIGPAGRFFDNTEGSYNYSKPILEVGVRRAIQDMNYDLLKFIGRGGLYNWGNN